MPKNPAIRDTSKDFRNSWRPNTPSSVINTPPALDNIPVEIDPSIYLSRSVFQRLAGMTIHIAPSYERNWQAGVSDDTLKDDLFKGLNVVLEEFLRNNGIEPVMIEVLNDEVEVGIVVVKVFGFDAVLPIFYKEALKWVKSKTPRMERLFKQAIKVIGEKCYTWEDMRIDFTERVNDMYIPEYEHSGEDDEVEHLKERVEVFNMVGGKGERFFKRDESSLLKFKTMMRKFTPSSSHNERILYKWCSAVEKFINNHSLLSFINRDDDADWVPFHYIFSILYSKEDEITEEFSNELEYSSYSGASFGVQLEYRIDDDFSLGGVEEFLKELNLLGLYNKVFRFFNEIGR